MCESSSLRFLCLTVPDWDFFCNVSSQTKLAWNTNSIKWRNSSFLEAKQSHNFGNFTVAIMIVCYVTEYLCHRWLRYVSFAVVTTKSIFSFIMNYHRCIRKVTRWMIRVVQKLLTHREPFNSLPVYCGVRAVQSVVFCIIVASASFSFCHCSVCPSSIYCVSFVSSNISWINCTFSNG